MSSRRRYPWLVAAVSVALAALAAFVVHFFDRHWMWGVMD